MDGTLEAINDKVVIDVSTEGASNRVGDISITSTADAGYRAEKATVTSVGHLAKFTGLEVGNKVYFDNCATYGKQRPIATIDVENIIAIIREEKPIKPLFDNILVQHHTGDAIKKIGDIEMPIGMKEKGDNEYWEIVEVGVDWEQSKQSGSLSVGDKILIDPQTATSINIERVVYFIVPVLGVIAKINEKV